MAIEVTTLLLFSMDAPLNLSHLKSQYKWHIHQVASVDYDFIVSRTSMF